MLYGSLSQEQWSCIRVLQTESLCLWTIFFCELFNQSIHKMVSNSKSQSINIFLFGFAMTGHPLFQCLICVERYLAVVHPVTFLKFKPLRYRVICSGFFFLAGNFCLMWG